jgi:DNA-binding XRE family transcriptional regulator
MPLRGMGHMILIPGVRYAHARLRTSCRSAAPVAVVPDAITEMHPPTCQDLTSMSRRLAEVVIMPEALEQERTMTANIETVTLAGQRFVILPEADYRKLVGQTWEPPMPKPDAKGNFPAVEAARVVLARTIIRGRRAAGLTQAELAKRAGVRVETLSRLEHAKHSPNVATVDRIVRALEQADTTRAVPSPSPRRKTAERTRRKWRTRF